MGTVYYLPFERSCDKLTLHTAELIPVSVVLQNYEYFHSPLDINPFYIPPWRESCES